VVSDFETGKTGKTGKTGMTGRIGPISAIGDEDKKALGKLSAPDNQ